MQTRLSSSPSNLIVSQQDDLYIVVVNWNLKDDTLACLDSLVHAGARPNHIILIDNGSNDGSVEAIRGHFGEQIQLIVNPDNLGLVPASNQGFQRALQQDAGWILWLNNDTIVAEDFFHQMQPALQRRDYGILSPLIFYFSQPEIVWYLGDRLLPGTLITRNPYRGKPTPQGLPEIMPVDFLSGCAMFVQRQLFERLGYLDPELVMYGEEVDFCWRARLAGYQLGCVPKAHIWHKVSMSANRVMPQTRYYRTRNLIRFYNKYARGLQRPLMFLFSLLQAARLVLSDLVQRQTILIGPLARGWRDGWKM